MHMIDLRLNPERLVAHAQQQGHNRSQDEDLGYAAHAWLTAAVGDLAPHAFRLLQQRNGLRLLGYSDSDADGLRTQAQSYANPAAFAVCDWAVAASKPLDSIPLRAGQWLGFELRACPVVRGKRGERDAFLTQLPLSGEPSPATRTQVYRQWLTDRLSEAADIEPEAFRLKAFRLVSAWRQGEAKGGGRAGRRLVRPDALLSGQLRITDPQAFRYRLHHGVGRHRAFGFGMLLLKPA